MTAAKQDPINPDFLTVPQVAKRLQLGRNVVYQLVRAKTLPSIRVGRSIRISLPKLQKWVAEADGHLELR